MKEMQIKTIMKWQYTSMKMAKKQKKPDNTSSYADTEQLQCPYTAGADSKCYSHS